jgi:hypothetical protein
LCDVPAAGAGETGASWADVGLAIVSFAREEPWTFAGVASLLIVLTILASFCLWLMLPAASASLARMYDRARQEARYRNRDLFDDECSSSDR